jgi:hypothetical protein
MGWLEELIQKITRSIADTIRRFTAYSLLLVFFGTIYGFYLGKIATFTGVDQYILMFIPIVLAFLAYVSTEIAFLLFLGLIGLVLLVLI